MLGESTKDAAAHDYRECFHHVPVGADEEGNLLGIVEFACRCQLLLLTLRIEAHLRADMPKESRLLCAGRSRVGYRWDGKHPS